MKEQRLLGSVYNGQALTSSASFKTKTNVISPVAITSQERRMAARETKQTLILTISSIQLRAISADSNRRRSTGEFSNAEMILHCEIAADRSYYINEFYTSLSTAY